MNAKSKQDNDKVMRTVALYNMVPNLLWSIINLTPIAIYCFNLVEPARFYIFLTVSLAPIFLKNNFLDQMQLGSNPTTYKRLGVHWINKVAQNGMLINALIKKKFPDHKVVKPSRASITALINQTYVFEKFHLLLFLFFTITMVDAFVKGHWGWVCIIFVTNLLYNIYPNLLQQYIRLKLVLFKTRWSKKY